MLHQIVADLHTHSVCTSHAYQTVNEMAAGAKEKGLCALAITDHGPAMPDAPHSWHFGNWNVLPRVVSGVAMLYGAEANVMDIFGGLVLPQCTLEKMDWVIASIHSPCLPGNLTRKEADRLWRAVAENPLVDCIGHSEQECYRYDYDILTKVFARNQKVVELNGHSFVCRKDGIPNLRALIKACYNSGCRIALDGDAHSVGTLGENADLLWNMLDEIGFPEELVINAGRENLVKELTLHRKNCAAEIGGIIL